ncbi:MAG: hypothetical protein JWO88_2456 [Frankiales bacterium]|nr:hypothetical protein [Frankiales bacterium]
MNKPMPSVPFPLSVATRAFAPAIRFAVRAVHRDDTARVQQAWLELKEHPALNWVPPLWRPDDDSPQAQAAARRHRISALQRNLRIDMVERVDGVRVRLVTAPLTDLSTPDGVDPLQPAMAQPDLVGEAPTFEEALLALRDAVRRLAHTQESVQVRGNAASR